MTSGYDAVMLVAFGGPESMAEVRPFLRRVLAGKPVPQERFEEVVRHYERIGGRSPLGEITRRQAAALQAALTAAGVQLEVALGMRNSEPFLSDTLAALRKQGAERVLCVIMAAHESAASHGRYHEALDAAVRELGSDGPALGFTAGFHLHQGFIEANVAHTRSARALLPQGEPALLVFTAHSVPVAMASPYVEQLQQSAAAVAAALGQTSYHIAYQSRSGSPREPWLEPDINQLIREQSARGVRALLLCPIGFVCDHVEVLYDLDVEAAETARSLGVALARGHAVNDHPGFIAALLDRVREAR
jgi:ferrochelatase